MEHVLDYIVLASMHTVGPYVLFLVTVFRNPIQEGIFTIFTMHTLVVLLAIMQSTVGIPADRRLPPRPPPSPACAQGQ